MVGKIRRLKQDTNADDAILLSNVESKIIWCNNAAEKLFRFLPKDIIGKTILEILNINSEQTNLFEQLADSGHWQREMLFIREEKVTRLGVSVNVVRDETGDPAAMVVIISPGSGKMVENNFDNNRSLSNILNTLTEGACIIDSDYNITYLNPALEKICGYPHGKCYQHFFGQTDVCRWCDRFEKRTEKAVEWKSSYTSQGRTYEFKDSLINDSFGRRRILRIFHDVTKHIRIAEEYMDYKQQVQEIVAEHKTQSEQSSKLLQEKLKGEVDNRS